MLSFLVSVAAFIVAIGVLVTIHEFGHFWVAKQLNIKVLRFSVGFGKVLTSYTRGETTYTLCAIPLGGFVKMLDEAEGEVAKAEQHRAFNRQSVYKRIAVVAAGPLANFLLAILLYTLIFVLGVEGVKPVVDKVKEDSIAQQVGLAPGDQLLSLNQVETRSINEFANTFLSALGQAEIPWQVKSDTNELKQLTLAIGDDYLNQPEQGIETYLGFDYRLPKLPAVIEKVWPNTPAERAGLRAGDQVMTANNQAIEDWPELVEVIRSSANQAITLEVQRQQQLITLQLTPELKDGSAKAGLSVAIPEDYLATHRVKIQEDLPTAVVKAVQKTYQLTWLNLKMIGKMLGGSASVEQISGPLSIADFAGKSAQVGLVAFLSFLALISVGLGLINLLPIPLLDGGHLLFYVIEIIKGSPVSLQTQQFALRFGIWVILSLTFIALYNDVLRLF